MVGKHQAASHGATRAKYAGAEPAAANDIPPGATVVTTAAQLSHLIRTEVTAALEEAGTSKNDGPRLLDRHELAAALRVSPSTLDKLRRLGLPERKIGDSPRFDYQTCIAWIDANQSVVSA